MFHNLEENNEQSKVKTAKPVRLVYELPPDCVPLMHQAAGHFFGAGKRGLLQNGDGIVIKPEQTRDRGDEEHTFFKKLFTSTEALNEDELRLKHFLPAYLGEFIHNDVKYIKMQHIARGIEKPMVIDLKIGQLTYVPNEASDEKIRSNKSKYPLSKALGWQISGLRRIDVKDMIKFLDEV